MSEFDPSHYLNGIKAGLTDVDMSRNIQGRASQSATFLAETCSKTACREYEDTRFAELVEELRTIRRYYLAFSDWLHDAYNRKAAEGQKDMPLADWLKTERNLNHV